MQLFLRWSIDHKCIPISISKSTTSKLIFLTTKFVLQKNKKWLLFHEFHKHLLWLPPPSNIYRAQHHHILWLCPGFFIGQSTILGVRLTLRLRTLFSTLMETPVPGLVLNCGASCVQVPIFWGVSLNPNNGGSKWSSNGRLNLIKCSVFHSHFNWVSLERTFNGWGLRNNFLKQFAFCLLGRDKVEVFIIKNNYILSHVSDCLEISIGYIHIYNNKQN